MRTGTAIQTPGDVGMRIEVDRHSRPIGATIYLHRVDTHPVKQALRQQVHVPR